MFLALIIKFSNQPSARRTQSHIIETYVHLKLEFDIYMCVCVCVLVRLQGMPCCCRRQHIKAHFIGLLSLMTGFAGHKNPRSASNSSSTLSSQFVFSLLLSSLLPPTPFRTELLKAHHRTAYCLADSGLRKPSKVCSVSH